MFYETAQTIGPGWHRSYKPSHYEDMTWSPSSRHFRSPGSSPETYRRIIHTEEDFPKRSKDADDDFFSGRRSPTFPRRIFKEVWSESPTSNHRFADRPRMFKRVFKPSSWDDDFDRDIPHIRRVERSYDDCDDGRPLSRNFDDEFDKRFSARDLQKDIEEEFQKAEGRVHHIPIMVERRMEEMKSRFGRNSPPPERERANEEEYADEWVGPQVQNLRKNFEPNHDNFSSKFSHRLPKDLNARPRSFTVSDTWDPHAVHTLPTRKAHKNSQSFDDSRHPVTPKSVYRSYSETHEDVPRQQPQHSAAFRSHSDGHCPKQTYVTKIEVNLPSQKEKEEPGSKHCESNEQANNESNRNSEKPENEQVDNSHRQNSEAKEEPNVKPRMKYKHENPSLQQIAVVLQNVEDLVLRVESYNGTGRDKHYRFLDEMLTRCMLRLDDVDTEGREDIRSARKAAVREVQSCIDKLEAKADESDRRHQKKKQVDSSPDSGVPENKDSVVDKEQSDSVKEEENEPPKEEVTNNGGNEQTKL